MTASLLKHPPFFILWTGSAVSELGGAFGTFSCSILIYEMTESKAALSSMWLLYFLPSLLLQLFIGPFIDRWSKKWIMFVSQAARGIVFLLPLLAIFQGSLQVWHILTVQIIIGLIMPLYVPASQAILPELIDQEKLETANAYLDGLLKLMMFTAPVLGGVAIQFAGTTAVLATTASLYLLSSVFLLVLKEKRKAVKPSSTWIKQFAEGISFYCSQKTILWLGMFLAVVQFGVGVSMVINLPYITEELSGNYRDYGYFAAGFPAGYICGAVLAGKLVNANSKYVILLSLLAGGSTYIFLGFSFSIYLSVFIEAAAGIAMAFFHIYNTSLVQKIVPQNLMGKVFSVRLFMIRAAMPAGVAAAGLFSDIIGIRGLFVLIGLIICTASAAGLILPYFSFLRGEQKKESMTK
ncbi:MFS transporter [Bacillus lacus]|uniref:MFS transporter n=1 Tax=Metabacillus lacus TaxID=1983721 RepID=A0A7X2IY92_9BACI|nr:MFS transporter [Metabacillus lacus]MRX71875.1 MFS transporter [Metabacillus lacus]